MCKCFVRFASQEAQSVLPSEITAQNRHDELTGRRAGLNPRAMARKLTDQLVDKRLIDRNLQKGTLDDKKLKAHLQSLKDVADNAENVPYYDTDKSEE